MRSIRRSGSIDAFMGNRKDRQHGQTARRDLVARITLMGEARVTPLKKEKPASQPAFLVDRNQVERNPYSAGGNASGSASGAVGTIVACFSRSSRISLSRLTATSRILAIEAPVPAGISRPTMTFSLRPSSGSTLPLTAGSVEKP